MIECTLQEAIKKYKENGGFFYQIGYPDIKCYVKGQAIIFNTGKGETGYPLRVCDICATWIYEPPKESAFQKWEKVQNENIIGPDAQFIARKEGWDAAIDTVLTLKRNPARDLQDINEIHPAIWCHEIKELKEP